MEASTATTGSPEPAEAGSETPVTSQTAPTTEAQPPETGERDESGRYLSREAANYRTRLRQTEQERDSLREQLDRFQTAEAERLAGAAGLAAPSDLWQFGAKLDALRGEDGAIDAETVNGLVDEIVKDRPGLQARPIGDLGIGKGASAAGTRTGEKIGLSALLKPDARR